MSQLEKTIKDCEKTGCFALRYQDSYYCPLIPCNPYNRLLKGISCSYLDKGQTLMPTCQSFYLCSRFQEKGKCRQGTSEGALSK